MEKKGDKDEKMEVERKRKSRREKEREGVRGKKETNDFRS